MVFIIVLSARDEKSSRRARLKSEVSAGAELLKPKSLSLSLAHSLVNLRVMCSLAHLETKKQRAKAKGVSTPRTLSSSILKQRNSVQMQKG